MSHDKAPFVVAKTHIWYPEACAKVPYLTKNAVRSGMTCCEAIGGTLQALLRDLQDTGPWWCVRHPRNWYSLGYITWGTLDGRSVEGVECRAGLMHRYD